MKISFNKSQRSRKEITLITIIAVIIILLAIVGCRFSIKSKSDNVLHYSDNSKLDYNVYLKENNFYTTPYLPKDRAYVSTLIDYIDASFDYNFDVVEDINLGYKYYISSKLVVEESSGKKIFDKEEMLLDESEVQKVQDKRFSISENIKIDYNKYNELASSFKDNYDLSAKASVVVSMYVEVVGTHESFERDLNDSAVVSLEIPLTTTTTEIKMNYDLKNNSDGLFEYGKTSIVHPVLLVLSIIVAVVVFSWTLCEILAYSFSKDDKVKYQEKLKKIFRDYGDYISKKAMTTNTKEIMYTMSLRVEVVDSFDDLINARDSIEKPILFYESIPGEQAVFYIIDTKVSYIYIMNARDCNSNKKIVDSDIDIPIQDEKKLLPTVNVSEAKVEEVDQEDYGEYEEEIIEDDLLTEEQEKERLVTELSEIIYKDLKNIDKKNSNKNSMSNNKKNNVNNRRSRRPVRK